MPTTVTDALLKQAEASDGLGSPFTAGLCRLLATRLDHTTRFGRRILDWPGNPHSDALALRACGALHALARSGEVPALSAAYPPAAFDGNALRAGLAAAVASHDDALAAYLDRPPQTNEVARSAIILGAALHVAARTGLPIELFEIGASAGLNLRFDRYGYDLGNGRSWGAENAPVRIACDWRGVLPPLAADLRVVERSGCDRTPLDPGREGDVSRLLSYVWPDQVHRLERTGAALRMAAGDGIKVANADAADWMEEVLGRPPREGVTRLLYHTIAWQYFPAEVKSRAEAALVAAGKRATANTPFAHFSFEADGTIGSGALQLRIWPDGQLIPLGRGDFHGRWAEWMEPQPLT
jgi:hypothetical protein